MVEKLNGHTRAEIAEAFARVSKRQLPQEKECLWCGKTSRMRADQTFCSPAHRAAYAREAARLQYEKLVAERESWQQEREGYIREISELRKLLSPTL